MQSRSILMSITFPEAVSKGREQTLYSVAKEMCKQSGSRSCKHFSCARKVSILHAPSWVYRIQKEHLVQYTESISENSKMSSKMHYNFFL